MPYEVIDLVSSEDEAAGNVKPSNGGTKPAAKASTKSTNGFLDIGGDSGLEDLLSTPWREKTWDNTSKNRGGVAKYVDRPAANGKTDTTRSNGTQNDAQPSKRRKLSNEKPESTSFTFSVPGRTGNPVDYNRKYNAYLGGTSNWEWGREEVDISVSKSPTPNQSPPQTDSTEFGRGKGAKDFSPSNKKRLDDTNQFGFASSAHVQPKSTTEHNNKFAAYIWDLSDSDWEKDISDTSRANSVIGTQLSEGTRALLARINGSKPPARKISGAHKNLKESGTTIKRARSKDESVRSRSPSAALSGAAANPLAKKRVRLTSTERELKAQERELKKKQKGKEKEDEKDKRRQEREAQKREKEAEKEAQKIEKDKAAALAEINRANNDKRVTVLDMIVDLPSSIRGQAINTQIRKFLRSHNVPAVEYDSPIPNVIRWRRKVAKEFNEELGHWTAAEERIETEKHIICLLSAKEFVALAIPSDDDGETLEKHVASLKSAYKDCKPIYLIEGLDALVKKSKNARNRAHQAAARSAMGAADAIVTSSRKRKDEAFDEDRVEDELLRLQVIHHCLIHQTATTVETAEWVATGFTQHISTIPYK
jgi:hypothetical protein